jgi:hypothetical protein
MYNSQYLTNIGSMWTALMGRTSSLETKTNGLTSTTDELSTAATNLAQANSQLTTKTNNLLANMVYSYSGVTTSDGTFTIDYSALGLTKVPKVVGFSQLAAIGDIPVYLSMIGAPTLTGAKLSVRKLASILGTGLLPQYAGVAGIPVDVYVRPAP